MEYVTKKEVKPWRVKFDTLISKIRPILKERGITFNYNLVGSAKRNLVIRNHNKGFDCDYQIYVMKNKKNLSPKDIKLLFINLIDEYKSVEFDNCEDRTTSIKLKYKNINESKIIFSYDIVIMKFEEEMKVIKKVDEENNIYKFEPVKDYSKYIEKIKLIKGNDLWNKLRELYYKEKNNNKNNKKSFQIFYECVINIIDNHKNKC